MAKVVQVREGKSTPVFDPNKQYRWNPGDIFEFTGQQLATLYHCMTQEMRSTGGNGATLLLKSEAYLVIMDIFRNGVEQGVIIESETQPPSSQEITESANKVFE